MNRKETINRIERQHKEREKIFARQKYIRNLIAKKKNKNKNQIKKKEIDRTL